MAKKISELPATTSPPSTVEIAVVDSGTTKKTTAGNLAPALLDTRLGWFSVGHNGANQENISSANDPVQMLVDALGSNQGGFDSLPQGVSGAMAYTAGASGVTSKIHTDWMEEGQAFILKVDGSAVTQLTNTTIDLIFNFYNASGFVFAVSTTAGFFKSATTVPFSALQMIFVSADMATTGSYLEVEVDFDTGTTNALDMGGFMLSVIK